MVDLHARTTHALDNLAAAVAELDHWLRTGERVQCSRCAAMVPAVSPGVPGRHQMRGQWCDEQAGDAVTDDALLADLRRVAATVDPAPRPATPFIEERDALDCSAYPEGSSRHDYRRTTARPGEAAWKCRDCGDVFVALNSEIEAAELEGEW